MRLHSYYSFINSLKLACLRYTTAMSNVYWTIYFESKSHLPVPDFSGSHCITKAAHKNDIIEQNHSYLNNLNLYSKMFMCLLK